MTENHKSPTGSIIPCEHTVAVCSEPVFQQYENEMITSTTQVISQSNNLLVSLDNHNERNFIESDHTRIWKSNIIP